MDNLESKQFRTVLGALAGLLARPLLRRDDFAIDKSADVIDDQVRNGTDRERAVRELERSSGYVRELKRALARLGAEADGVCERCNSQISIIRSKAVRWAAHCMGCQNSLDRQSSELRARRRVFSAVGATLLPLSGRFAEDLR